ncbi:MAG TPA: hypothetical protein VF011_11630 [Terriglobales bacterium]
MKLTAGVWIFLLLASLSNSQSAPTNSATVPITLDHNRIIIDVYFPMADGSKTRVRGWVDPGDAKISITQALAKKLGLTASAEKPDQSGKDAGDGARSTQAPRELLVGAMNIHLSAVREATTLPEESIAPGSSASIKLPATVLRNYDVSIDYLNREFTIASPGSIHFEGTAIRASVGATTGLIQLECHVDGEKYTVSFDPGTSVSWLSGELLSRWHKLHPDWPSMIGAVGPANLWGLAAEPTWHVLRIPGIDCGGVELTNGIAVPFDKDTLEWFQKRAGVPTIGLIGADVLLNYRVGIDYAHSTVYLKQLSKYTPPGVDVAGLTLRPEENGRYTVIGLAEHDGKSSVPEARIGDTLLTVDNARVTGGTMGQVWSLLSGSPGDVRTLGLEREGKPLTVKATVYRFLLAVRVASKSKKN